MRNAKCFLSAECGVLFKCGMRNAECGMRNYGGFADTNLLFYSIAKPYSAFVK